MTQVILVLHRLLNLYNLFPICCRVVLIGLLGLLKLNLIRRRFFQIFGSKVHLLIHLDLLLVDHLREVYLGGRDLFRTLLCLATGCSLVDHFVATDDLIGFDSSGIRRGDFLVV